MADSGLQKARPLQTAPVPTVPRPSAEDINPEGLGAIRMLRGGLVGDRVCDVGDIIRVDPLKGRTTIFPMDKKLDFKHALKLISLGFAVAHQIKPGDKVVSVVADPPPRQPLPTAPPQYAMLTPQKTADKAVTERQGSGAI